MENMSGTMDHFTKESGSRIRSMEKVSTFGQTEENTMANGETITCMEKVSTPGKTVECMKVSTKMTESMVMESTPGMMESNTRAGGKMANNTEKVFIEKTVEIEGASGKMAKESNGSMIPSGEILLVELPMELAKVPFKIENTVKMFEL